MALKSANVLVGSMVVEGYVTGLGTPIGGKPLRYANMICCCGAV
jgi:hypothetical protein